jgi:hypothetical protein
LTKVEDAYPQGRSGGIRRGHEANTVGVRGLLLFAAALIGTGIVIPSVLGLMMEHLARTEHPPDSLSPGRPAIDVDQFPAPRLQEDPASELDRMKREERRRIDAYGWVDPKAGIAHIPIKRAMDILAQTGLPKVPAPAPGAGAPPNTSIPPATKREEPGQGTDRPSAVKKEETRPESKQEGKP